MSTDGVSEMLGSPRPRSATPSLQRNYQPEKRLNWLAIFWNASGCLCHEMVGHDKTVVTRTCVTEGQHMLTLGRLLLPAFF